MKLLYLILLLLLCFVSNSSQAQQKFSLGVLAAPSIENRIWLGDDWINFRPKASFNYGLLMKFYLNEQFFLQTGISIYDKGSRYYVRFISHVPNSEYYLDTLHHTRIVGHTWYLSSPTTINMILIHSDRTRLHLSGGVTYGRRILVYDTFKFDNSEYDKEYIITSYSSNKINYWGASLGFGMNYRLSPRFSLEIKPNYIRQLTRGWSESTTMDNRGRHDSYVLDLVLWWNP